MRRRTTTAKCLSGTQAVAYLYISTSKRYQRCEIGRGKVHQTSRVMCQHATGRLCARAHNIMGVMYTVENSYICMYAITPVWRCNKHELRRHYLCYIIIRILFSLTLPLHFLLSLIFAKMAAANGGRLSPLFLWFDCLVHLHKRYKRHILKMTCT